MTTFLTDCKRPFFLKITSGAHEVSISIWEYLPGHSHEHLNKCVCIILQKNKVSWQISAIPHHLLFPDSNGKQKKAKLPNHWWAIMRTVVLRTVDAKTKTETQVFVCGTDCERLLGDERCTSRKPTGKSLDILLRFSFSDYSVFLVNCTQVFWRKNGNINLYNQI